MNYNQMDGTVGEQMSLIPESHKDLLEDKSKALAFLATTLADGSPQVSPVWFNWDGEYI